MQDVAPVVVVDQRGRARFRITAGAGVEHHQHHRARLHILRAAHNARQALFQFLLQHRTRRVVRAQEQVVRHSVVLARRTGRQVHAQAAGLARNAQNRQRARAMRRDPGQGRYVALDIDEALGIEAGRQRLLQDALEADDLAMRVAEPRDDWAAVEQRWQRLLQPHVQPLAVRCRGGLACGRCSLLRRTHRAAVVADEVGDVRGLVLLGARVLRRGVLKDLLHRHAAVARVRVVHEKHSPARVQRHLQLQDAPLARKVRLRQKPHEAGALLDGGVQRALLGQRALEAAFRSVAGPRAASVSLHHHGDLGDRAPFALLAAFDHCGGGGRPRRPVVGVSFFVCSRIDHAWVSQLVTV